MDYKDYNDFELLEYIAENNDDATNIMYKKYEPLITGIAKKMSKYTNGSGLELNDLIQEGMLGLSNAIDNFTYSKEASFYTYAKTCIERKILSQIVSTTRLKRKILNESISLEMADESGQIKNIEYLFSDKRDIPENILMSDEYIKELMDKAADVLTNLELQVFELKINNFDYKEIAEILDKEPKSIDNAIQRIRTKMKKVLEDK